MRGKERSKLKVEADGLTDLIGVWMKPHARAFKERERRVLDRRRCASWQEYRTTIIFTFLMGSGYEGY